LRPIDRTDEDHPGWTPAASHAPPLKIERLFAWFPTASDRARWEQPTLGMIHLARGDPEGIYERF
jgi:hypothetical protein